MLGISISEGRLEVAKIAGKERSDVQADVPLCLLPGGVRPVQAQTQVSKKRGKAKGKAGARVNYNKSPEVAAFLYHRGRVRLADNQNTKAAVDLCGSVQLLGKGTRNRALAERYLGVALLNLGAVIRPDTLRARGLDSFAALVECAVSGDIEGLRALAASEEHLGPVLRLGGLSAMAKLESLCVAVMLREAHTRHKEGMTGQQQNMMRLASITTTLKQVGGRAEVVGWLAAIKRNGYTNCQLAVSKGHE
ncbi:hypothetical protein KIPB_004279, partial [Kipferlia bialata]|eukprot:g4279.t1